MVNIKILDMVPQASTYEDGDIIYKKIYEIIESGGSVAVSFDGIHAVPSAFINSAFIRLLEIFDFQIIKKNLYFIDSTKYINDLIKSRFEFALRK